MRSREEIMANVRTREEIEEQARQPGDRGWRTTDLEVLEVLLDIRDQNQAILNGMQRGGFFKNK